MDPRDQFRPAPDGVAPTACGASVPADRAWIVARIDAVIGAR